VAEAGVHPLYWADVELRAAAETELDFTRELIERIDSGRVAWPHKKLNKGNEEKRRIRDGRSSNGLRWPRCSIGFFMIMLDTTIVNVAIRPCSAAVCMPR